MESEGDRRDGGKEGGEGGRVEREERLRGRWVAEIVWSEKGRRNGEEGRAADARVRVHTHHRILSCA